MRSPTRNGSVAPLSYLARASVRVVAIAEDATILWASPTWRDLQAGVEDPGTGTSLLEHIHPDDVDGARDAITRVAAVPGPHPPERWRVVDPRGRTRWVDCHPVNALTDPSVGAIVISVRAIADTERTDALTGLPNRAGFVDRVRRALDVAADGARVTVVYLDLDEFKLVNESLGHASGDELLREVAARLRTRVREGDLVARLGGDDFAVLVQGGDEALPLQMAERMAEAFEEPIEVAGGSFFVSVSIGVAATPPHEPANVLRNAESAMYRAKALGRARIEFFDTSVADDAVAALHTRSELRRAIDRQEFVLHFQPIMDLASRRVDGMEALVRWAHPERGMVPPLSFITAAEDSGLIVELGAWVLRQSCREAATWPEDMHVAVNLSVRQLADRAIVAVVADALAASGLDPGRLVLEVTESALMANAELAIGCLRELKALGVRLAIDDFGTGYSSLVYLKRMPVDAIKVDRSFVDGLGDDAEDTAIVSSVVRLAHAVGVQAIAEGVETAEQQAHLRDLGCDLAQGFLWSRPVPADELRDLLAQQHP